MGVVVLELPALVFESRDLKKLRDSTNYRCLAGHWMQESYKEALLSIKYLLSWIPALAPGELLSSMCMTCIIDGAMIDLPVRSLGVPRLVMLVAWRLGVAHYPLPTHALQYKYLIVTLLKRKEHCCCVIELRHSGSGSHAQIFSNQHLHCYPNVRPINFAASPFPLLQKVRMNVMRILWLLWYGSLCVAVVKIGGYRKRGKVLIHAS